MNILPLIIELVVAGLLATTVGYCIALDRRLQRLRADEQSMRQTVVDLGIATERAERAIDALRLAIAECDRTLAERLRAAEAQSQGLEQSIRSGDEVLDRIFQTVTAARRAFNAMNGEEAEAPQEPPSKLSETLAAAEAFAERARQRLMDHAA
jgi:DNA-binding FrmR family transcriptional regulator